MTSILLVEDARELAQVIPPEELPHIWVRFYHGGDARTRDARGAGLGLALVKELTEAMGSRVAVESEIGRGSTFTVWLPRSPRART
jgi:signal transduction histidine kinase